MYIFGSFNNLQNFRSMTAVNMEIIHPLKVQIILEHKPYFSEPNYKSRKIISIAYYLHQIHLFQYKYGFSVSPHLRLLVLDSECRSQVSIEASPYWICGGKKKTLRRAFLRVVYLGWPLSVLFHHCSILTFIHLLPTIWS